MKKLLIGVLAAMCCLAMTAPVFAEVTLSGMITTDVYYWKQSGEASKAGFVQTPGATNGDNGLSEFQINAPHSWNRMIARYASDDKNIRGHIELRMGGPNSTSSAAGTYLNYSWIDWQFNPNFYVRLGRQDQAFASFTPMLTMGQNDMRILAMGFGNIHGGSSRDGIRFMPKFNDNVRMEIGIYDPDVTGLETSATGPIINTPANATGAVVREENKMPRIDLAVPITVANFKIEPSFTYLKQSYDQVIGGSEDSIKIWGTALGLGATFGPFTARAEITYGENLGNGNYAGASSAANAGARRYVSGLNSLVADTETLAWWIELGFNFGPAQVLGVVGYNRDQNDGSPTTTLDDRDIKRMIYGISVPIFVAKNFTVRPEFVYYDFGSDELNGVNNPIRVDYGHETMIGVQFMLTF